MERLSKFIDVRYLFIASVLFLLFSLAYLINSFVYVYLVARTEVKPSNNPNRYVLSNESPRSLSFLFFKPVQKQSSSGSSTSQYKAAINFTLIGTLIADTSKSAIININNTLKTIKLFQSIEDGIKVVDIEEFYIIVDNYGEKRTIVINQNFNSGEGSSNLPPLKNVVPIPDGGTQSYTLDKTMVQELTRDMGQFLKDVKIKPYFENGVTKGFMFDSVKEGSLLAQNGIAPGDRIISINGNPVVTTEDSFKLYNMLRTEKFVTLVVEGPSGRRTINYEIR